MNLKGLFVVVLAVMFATSANAAVFNLGNGDKISGTIVEETEDTVTVRTRAMGNVVIDKAYIKEDAPAAKAPDADDWKRKVSLSYVHNEGNTVDSSGSLVATADRKTEDDEYNFKYSALIASEDYKQDDREFYASGRYAYSFGDDKKWFNAFKIEGDHDRFDNIDVRIVPSTGIGYWFEDQEDYKLMAELSAGLEYTKYIDGSDSDTDFVLIPHGYWMKKFGAITLYEDITLYPQLDDLQALRLKSETGLTTPIADNLDLKVTIVNKFDGDPQGDVKKHDFGLNTGLEYKF